MVEKILHISFSVSSLENSPLMVWDFCFCGALFFVVRLTYGCRNTCCPHDQKSPLEKGGNGLCRRLKIRLDESIPNGISDGEYVFGLPR